MLNAAPIGSGTGVVGQTKYLLSKFLVFFKIVLCLPGLRERNLCSVED